MTFAEIIKGRCEDLLVNKSELARRLGVTVPRVRALLKQANMTEKTFKRCLEVLGLEIDVFEKV